jgi:hypothetical protein
MLLTPTLLTIRRIVRLAPKMTSDPMARAKKVLSTIIIARALGCLMHNRA